MFLETDNMNCPNLAVPAQVMRHVVHVESSANPFAIGVVGAQLVRQPKTLEEALATAKMLESGGYNYSLGAAQVNRINFRKYGLDTHEKAFDVCANLAAGARILANCYASAGGDWGKAFSCYYSGNFVTGFRSGYVQKIYDSIRRGETVAETRPTVSPIPLRATSAPLPGATPVAATPGPAIARPAEAQQATTAASRISMRAVPFGISSLAATPTIPVVSAPAPAPLLPPKAVADSDVFVPQVRYLSTGNAPVQSTRTASPEKPVDDSAFVF